MVPPGAFLREIFRKVHAKRSSSIYINKYSRLTGKNLRRGDGYGETSGTDDPEIG
jgi:hypothetical protein